MLCSVFMYLDMLGVCVYLYCFMDTLFEFWVFLVVVCLIIVCVRGKGNVSYKPMLAGLHQ